MNKNMNILHIDNLYILLTQAQLHGKLEGSVCELCELAGQAGLGEASEELHAVGGTVQLGY